VRGGGGLDRWKACISRKWRKEKGLIKPLGRRGIFSLPERKKEGLSRSCAKATLVWGEVKGLLRFRPGEKVDSDLDAARLPHGGRGS